MKICIVLPKFARKAIGGYKIAFEYANRLSKRGYQVEILFMNKVAFEGRKMPSVAKSIASNIMTEIEPRWFDLDKNIKKISGLKHGFEEKIRDVDVAIATAQDTVEAVKNFFPNAKKVYLIQDYEVWCESEENVWATYKEGFTNIVISEWLKEIVDKIADVPSVLIKDPVDTEAYRCKIELKKRKKHSIAFLYHSAEYKGTVYAIKAIKKLKEKYQDLEVRAFGTTSKPSDIPSYVQYTHCATQAQTIEIYNNSSVFLCATVAEGYGLTGLEAMACGTALVSTDYQGVHEYATDGVNALLSPVKDVCALVANVSKLFDDDELRYQIAKSGIKSVQKDFNWDVAVDKFEKAIMT